MKLSPGTKSPNNDDVIGIREEKKQSSTMFVIIRELCFIFAVLFTMYATFVNTQPKTQRGALPSPFFNDPNIKDFYSGELSELLRDVSNQHFTFVMYYAPWDADSQDAKDEFIETSLFYGHKVFFAGVNCWEPSSECRSTFKDVISSFPQLVAYVGQNRAVEYKGPHVADHMIKFLHSIIHPVVRLDSASELWKLRSLHDAVLVGHLMFHGVIGGLGYHILYEAALRLATRDHERHTAVAVFTNLGNNKLLGLEEKQSLVLYLWNQRIEYTGKAEVDEVVKWVTSQVEKGLPDLNSNTLLPHMSDGGLMVMFTPRHPLSTITPYYQLLKRVAMNFNYCRNGTDSSQENDFFSYVVQYRSLNPTRLEQVVLQNDENLRNKCKIRKKWKLRSQPCSSVTVSQWHNMTCFNNEVRGMCRSPSSSGAIDQHFTSSYLVPHYDSDADRVKNQVLDDKCAILERSPLPFVPRDTSEVVDPPTACQTNKTFSFIALDTLSFSHLANGLGLRLHKLKHRTSVVILDNEEVLKLNTTEVSDQSVTDLLERYLSGERQRPLRSATDTINFHNSPKQKQDGETISLIELNTHTFTEVALNNSLNVVLMYHSPYCSFCLTLSNIFLSLAYLLKQITNLRFARIDGELNDLPWQFSVPTYPSVLFLPANRKSESRMFPHKLPFTMHSLASFVASNLAKYERAPVLLALCSRWGQNPMATSEGEMCLRDVRINVVDSISEMLRSYRKTLLRLTFSNELYFHNRLKSISRVLEYLNVVHHKLQGVTDVSSSIVHLELLKSQILERQLEL